MEKIVLYFVIIFFSNTIGAISGMGGGVIIKPMLDALSGDTLIIIGFYSSLAVFIMSIVSTLKNLSKPDVRNLVRWSEILTFALGSLAGGRLGDWLFNEFRRGLHNDSVVNLIQIVVLVVVLCVSLALSKPGHFKLSGRVKMGLFVIAGIFLGTISTFLGIGGGPINVALLIFVFSFSSKKAVLYSIVCIFFSQLMKLGTNLPQLASMGLNGGVITAIVIAAILGGYTGATITTHITNKQVLGFYKLVVVFVIGLNIVNGINLLKL